ALSERVGAVPLRMLPPVDGELPNTYHALPDGYFVSLTMPVWSAPCEVWRRYIEILDKTPLRSYSVNLQMSGTHLRFADRCTSAAKDRWKKEAMSVGHLGDASGKSGSPPAWVLLQPLLVLTLPLVSVLAAIKPLDE